MEFLVFEDNGGGFGWMIVTAGGEQLARSRSFASHDEAVVAARLVRDDAGSARLEDWQRTAPVDLVARRAAVRDAFDAERWLGERGNARGTLRAADALHE